MSGRVALVSVCPAAVARMTCDGRAKVEVASVFPIVPSLSLEHRPSGQSHGSFVRVFPPQEFLSDREHGQARLSTVAASGELLMVVVSEDRVDAIKAKVSTAREDWRSLMKNLQAREEALKVRLLPS